MQISNIGICNIALAHLGQRQIRALTDRVASAEACSLHFEEARLELLSDTLWNFSSMWASGVQLSIAPKPGWTYCFSYPPDALRIFEIQPLAPGGDVIPFEVTDRPEITLSGKMIHANVPAPVFIYSRDKADVTTYDQDAIQAFGWLMAAKMAMELTKNLKLAEKCERMYEFKRAKASARTQNEGERQETDTEAFHHKVR